MRTVARELGGIDESTMFGAPALKVRGKMIACIPTHRSAEPGSLVVRMDFESRNALLAEAPDVYYIKPHYENYPSVLVRLARIDAEAIRDLLMAAKRSVSSKR